MPEALEIAERSGGQRFAADLQGTEAPGPERQAVQVELEQVFEEAVLQLEVLRTEESAFGPDHRLQSLHLESQ